MIRFILAILILTTEILAEDIQILEQPKSVIDCVGEFALLKVTAQTVSGLSLKYQWYKDNMPITGEVGQVLYLPSLQHIHSGTYHCNISKLDDTENIKTNSASVYVLRPTSITREPKDVISNSEFGFVSINFDSHINDFSNDENIKADEIEKIQWYEVIENNFIKLENNKIYSGVNSNKLNINLSYISDTTYYYARIEGKCGTSTTRKVSVIKNYEIKIKIPSLIFCDGNTENIKANIINPNNYELEFQWYKDGKPLYFKENLKGIYSDELVFQPIMVNDAGLYKIEAKNKNFNTLIFSNEVKIEVFQKPEIVCVRIDTLIDLNEHLHNGRKHKFSAWLNIFYKKNSLPIQFDIYREGILVKTVYSDSTVFSLGNINYLDYIFLKHDSSKYWVVAHNLCGFAYSDTISLYKQTICDPFNQFHNLCVYSPFSIYLDYKPKEPLNQLEYSWYTHQTDVGIFLVPIESDYAKATEKKLELADLRTYQQRENSETVTKYNTYYDVQRRIGSNTFIEDIFCCFYLKIGYTPVILRQPIDKQLDYGEKDTVFQIIFDNEFGKKIEVQLYYMAYLQNKPRLIDRAEPEYGRWYRYIKNITYEESGYYFAVVRYDNDCEPVISDTIKITVLPKSIVSGINDIENIPNFSISPNPANDFLEINIINNENYSDSFHFRIFDVLGIEMTSSVKYFNGSNKKGHNLDISHLPTGVYYLKIGNNINKFIKM